MQVDEKIKTAIDGIQSGKLNELLHKVDGTDFGFYIPVYEDNGVVKPMLEGYSQTERNLVISVGKKGVDDTEGALPVGWFGRTDAKDSSCSHGDHDKCRHCTSHQDRCRHCTHPKGKSVAGIDGAPKLDYHEVVKQIDHMNDLLSELASHGMGLTLLHGHNDQFMFTKLPEDYVAVVVNGLTTFRKSSDVAKDSTFVPNVWRSVNGQLCVAGGHSKNAEG